MSGGSAAPAGPRIGVVDYGAGNLVSIDQGLRAVGADVVLAHSPDALEGIDGLIVPGVGAARPAMNRLRRRRLLEPILDWARADRPYLGICLGLQLLFEGSDEDGARTFGLLPGRTVRLEHAPRLPHIGWNQVEWRHPDAPDPLFEGIADGANFYFVHSYAGRPAGGAAETEAEADDLVVADTTHGEPFVSAVRRGNLFGVQFHPERSGRDGLRLLANFVRSVEAARTPVREAVAA